MSRTAVAEPKTRPDDGDVQAFLAAVTDERRCEDAQDVCALMQEITGEAPVMWGDSIVGFGSRHLRYATGRELDWFIVGLSPRKQSLTLYLMDGFEEHTETLARLGRHTLGRACLYITRLENVDQQVLAELISDSWERAVTPGA